jgi:hypothetical protein
VRTHVARAVVDVHDLLLGVLHHHRLLLLHHHRLLLLLLHHHRLLLWHLRRHLRLLRLRDLCLRRGVGDLSHEHSLAIVSLTVHAPLGDTCARGGKAGVRSRQPEMCKRGPARLRQHTCTWNCWPGPTPGGTATAKRPPEGPRIWIWPPLWTPGGQVTCAHTAARQ